MDGPLPSTPHLPHPPTPPPTPPPTRVVAHILAQQALGVGQLGGPQSRLAQMLQHRLAVGPGVVVLGVVLQAGRREGQLLPGAHTARRRAGQGRRGGEVGRAKASGAHPAATVAGPSGGGGSTPRLGQWIGARSRGATPRRPLSRGTTHLLRLPRPERQGQAPTVVPQLVVLGVGGGHRPRERLLLRHTRLHAAQGLGGEGRAGQGGAPQGRHRLPAPGQGPADAASAAASPASSQPPAQPAASRNVSGARPGARRRHGGAGPHLHAAPAPLPHAVVGGVEVGDDLARQSQHALAAWRGTRVRQGGRQGGSLEGSLDGLPDGNDEAPGAGRAGTGRQRLCRGARSPPCDSPWPLVAGPGGA